MVVSLVSNLNFSTLGKTTPHYFHKNQNPPDISLTFISSTLVLVIIESFYCIQGQNQSLSWVTYFEAFWLVADANCLARSPLDVHFRFLSFTPPLPVCKTATQETSQLLPCLSHHSSLFFSLLPCLLRFICWPMENGESGALPTPSGLETRWLRGLRRKSAPFSQCSWVLCRTSAL